MKQTLIDLFEQNIWSNDRILIAAQTTKNLPDKARQAMAHLAIAERIWLSRIRAESLPMKVWEDLSFSEIETLLEETGKQWQTFLDDADEEQLLSDIAYMNTQGDAFVNTVRDITLHVTHHSAYHRGQINAIIREAGGEPAKVDYIFYMRD